ncbi:radical SAM protein [bacterium]|nr:radical SAM protein [bacterium]
MIDPFGRKIEIIRMSVTDRCNFRCTYCMPESGVTNISHNKIMRYEEIVEVVAAAVKLDITHFRLTGGEPLVRPGVTTLLQMMRSIPKVQEIALTTNGSLLAPIAEKLKTAGLDRVNISLDTLDPERFRVITRGGDIRDVLKGIEAAVDAGLTPVKLNIVVFPGENDRDARMVEEFAAEKNLISRRINKMDLQNGEFGIVENSDRGDCRVCNRLRLTSDGYMRCCLLNDRMYDVRKLGARQAIICAIKNKPERGTGTSISGMNTIGG